MPPLARHYLLLKFRVVEELVDLREDVDAGVAERTLLLLRDDAAGEHPPHHVDLVAPPRGRGGGGREQGGDEEDASHRFRGRLDLAAVDLIDSVVIFA